MDFITKLRESLLLLRDITTSSSTTEVFDKFQRLVSILNNTPEIAGFFFVVDPVVEYYPIKDFQYIEQSDSFLLPDRDVSIPRSEIVYTIVPTTGFLDIPPFSGGDVVEYIRGILLSVSPDLAPVIGEGISSAEEHIINILANFYRYLVNQIEDVKSQFFPETASGVYLLQLALLYGAYPSPPSPDKCLIRPIISIDTNYLNGLLERIKDELSNKLSNIFYEASAYLRNLYNTTGGILSFGENSRYSIALSSLTSIRDFYGNIKSGTEFDISIKVSGEIALNLVFPDDVFPKIYTFDSSSYIFGVSGSLTVKYRITPDNWRSDTFTVRWVDDSNNVLASNDITTTYPDPDRGINAEITSVTANLKYSPSFSLEGVGVRSNSLSTIASGVSYEFIPPADFQSIRVSPRTIINPYAPEANVLESSYVIPLWDPISQKTVLKFVVRDLGTIPVTVQYDEIVPIEENTSYTNNVQMLGYDVDNMSLQFGLALTLFKDLEALSDIARSLTSLSYSSPIFPIDVLLGVSEEFDTPLYTSIEFFVIKVDKGWLGDRIPILRSSDIINRGVLREGDIIGTLQRFLPVIASVDMVATTPENTIPPDDFIPIK